MEKMIEKMIEEVENCKKKKKNRREAFQKPLKMSEEDEKHF